MKERMANVDTAWLRMDDPTNLMMITGLILFKAPPDYQRLRSLLEERLSRFNRFRQRVEETRNPFQNPRWVNIEALDMDYHLQRVRLRDPGDEAALQELVSAQMSEPLDFRFPLWQVKLVDNYRNGGAALVRIHHCIADGIALVRVLLSLTDRTPEADGPGGHSPVQLQFPRMAAAKYLRTSFRGRPLWQRIGHGLVGAAAKTLSLARLTLLKPDPKTIFKGPLQTHKRAAWSRAFPLEEVKAIGKHFDCTVNDVLLSLVCGALRTYSVNHQVPVSEDLNIRAAVPINLREPDEPLHLGNEFGLLFLSLPIGIADPIQRLQELHRRALQLKRSVQSQVVLGVLGLIGMVPHFVHKLVVNFFGTKITAVMTNVPGPPFPIYLAGQEVEAILFWVPQSGKAGMGVSIFSYNNKVYIGVATDAGLVAQPEEIVQYMESEFQYLKSCIATS